MTGPLQKLRIVCVSDTHNHSPGEGYMLPKGDVLIHAGDLTNQGSLAELKKAVHWIEKADFRFKIVVAGNHDLSLDEKYELKHDGGWTVTPDAVEECRKLLAENSAFTYLRHSSTTISLPEQGITLRVFGSPYSPDRGTQNWAFQYSEDEADSLWSAVPEDTEILITHAPPAGHCDESKHWQAGGCPSLLQTLWRTRPALHVCGHCHEGRGAEIVRWKSKPDSTGCVESIRAWEDRGKDSKKQSLLDLTNARGGMALEAGMETAVVNASIMANSFRRGGKAFNKPIVVDIGLPPVRRSVGHEVNVSAPAAL